VPREKYVSAEDEYLLEDEHGRIKLIGDSLRDGTPMVTGIVIAVLGTEAKTGEFQVDDYCVAGFPPGKSLPRRSGKRGS
jgi:DNA polymerase delta subunit 2